MLIVTLVVAFVAGAFLFLGPHYAAMAVAGFVAVVLIGIAINDAIDMED